MWRINWKVGRYYFLNPVLKCIMYVLSSRKNYILTCFFLSWIILVTCSCRIETIYLCLRKKNQYLTNFSLWFYFSESILRLLLGQNLGIRTTGLQMHQLQTACAQKMPQAHQVILWFCRGKYTLFHDFLCFIFLFANNKGRIKAW